jgi:serine phosphatase RsbU (regulator of sigma subunit)
MTVTPLKADGPIAGVFEDRRFDEESAQIPKGASLHVFSDGVFEIEDKKGNQLGLHEFLPILNQAAVEGRSEPQRIYQSVRATSRPGPLDDDFSYLVVKYQ